MNRFFVRTISLYKCMVCMFLHTKNVLFLHTKKRYVCLYKRYHFLRTKQWYVCTISLYKETLCGVPFLRTKKHFTKAIA